jgi:hypothetical protein
MLFVISGHAKEKIGVHFEPFVPEGGNILVHGKSKVRYPYDSTSVVDPIAFNADPDPVPIRIYGFDDLLKFQNFIVEKNNFFENYKLLPYSFIPRPL